MPYRVYWYYVSYIIIIEHLFIVSVMHFSYTEYTCMVILNHQKKKK